MAEDNYILQWFDNLFIDGLIKLKEEFLNNHPTEEGQENLSGLNSETGDEEDGGIFEWSFNSELKDLLIKQARFFLTKLKVKIDGVIKHRGNKDELYEEYIHRIEDLIRKSKRGEAKKYPIIKQVLMEMIRLIRERKTKTSKNNTEDIMINSEMNWNKKKNKTPNELKALEDLFNDKKIVQQCISALIKVSTPIIDKKNNYLRGDHEKGAFTAWIKILRDQSKIKVAKDDEIARLLKKKFHGLEISGRTLRNLGTTAYNKYHSKLEKLIS
jgi:hypothetical protein